MTRVRILTNTMANLLSTVIIHRHNMDDIYQFQLLSQSLTPQVLQHHVGGSK